MEISVDTLFMIIGQKEAENVLLRRKVQELTSELSQSEDGAVDAV